MLFLTLLVKKYTMICAHSVPECSSTVAWEDPALLGQPWARPGGTSGSQSWPASDGLGLVVGDSFRSQIQGKAENHVLHEAGFVVCSLSINNRKSCFQLNIFNFLKSWSISNTQKGAGINRYLCIYPWDWNLRTLRVGRSSFQSFIKVFLKQ